ncbi:FecR family protein [Flavobacterium sp. LB2P53]|uniref:FecR family protein n=1 Tax=Flavobacterium sp. LB2P53 TaxID=2497481 RepID=UPI000F82FDDF|nr:FecR domain-containing protein [Flavobacterium sp. LB2P53]RTY65024.1 FecR family protein [Flavobacterium sp. LB2P53]
MKNEKEILKWLDDALSSTEIEDLKQSDSLQTLDKIAYYASKMEAPQVDAQEAFAAFTARNQSKKETKVRTLNFKTGFKVAAVLVVLLTSSYFLFFNNIQTFETQIAQTKTFNLPDDSEVILNSDSKITFNDKKWDDQRNLTLDGEAFFKVKKGKTFSVRTDAGIITVLGTQFNVKKRNKYFEVNCYEGLVSVSYKNQIVKLHPGKTFRIINDAIEGVQDLNAKNPSWIQEESSFDRVPLNQVIAELERQYDLKIKTRNLDTTKLFTGSFTHKDQNIALQAITIPLKLSYKMEGKTVIFYNYDEK